jgi:hypothetical protein
MDNINRIKEHIKKVEGFIAIEDRPAETGKLMVLLNMMYEQRDMAEFLMEHNISMTTQLSSLTKRIESHDRLVIQARVVIAIIVLFGGGFTYSISSTAQKYIEQIELVYSRQLVVMKDVGNIIEELKEHRVEARKHNSE